MERLALHIESLIFSSEHTISLNQIKTCIEETLEQTYKNLEIKKAIDSLIEKYSSDDFSFEIAEIASGYKFLTKGSFHNTVGTLIKKNNQKRLSKAALETLSIIAYKQPVTKSDVEGIRGVNCDYTIQKLLEKDLVTIKGRAEGPGRPLLYGTSDKFMDYFGIKDIDSLPKLQDLKVPEIQIGEPAPIEEDRVSSTSEANVQAEVPQKVPQDVDTPSESNTELDLDVDAQVDSDQSGNDDLIESKGLEEIVDTLDNKALQQDGVSDNIDGEKPMVQKQEIVDAPEDKNDEQNDRNNSIDSEKPTEEEAHQALLNQEIVSSVDINESHEDIRESISTTIISDEEE